MPDFVCSLITEQDVAQVIPPGPNYHLVRFPFTGESYDAHQMHSTTQPDTGQTVSYSNPRAGLIWPQHTAWAHLHALLYWDDGPYTEVRSRFVRDPLNLSTGLDSTCTEDHAATPGGQYIAKNWAIFVHPGTPIGVMVRHNADVPVRLAFAEFKLSYRRDAELP